MTYGVECTDSVHTRVLAVQVCECVPGSVPHGGCHAADAEPSRHEHTGAVEEASPLGAALSQQRRAPGASIPSRSSYWQDRLWASEEWPDPVVAGRASDVPISPRRRW